MISIMISRPLPITKLALINQGGLQNFNPLPKPLATSTPLVPELGSWAGSPAFCQVPMTIVGKGGKSHTVVEPRDGITDPEAFQKDETIKKHDITPDSGMMKKFNAGNGGHWFCRDCFFYDIGRPSRITGLSKKEFYGIGQMSKKEMMQEGMYHYINASPAFWKKVLINPYRDMESPTEDGKKREMSGH